MIKAGEESGKLDESFNYLADYLDRNFDLTQKLKKPQYIRYLLPRHLSWL